MGMYTELNIAVEFKEATPAEVIKALDYMATAHDEKPTEKDFQMDHPLFKTDRWDWMLRSGGSAYFDAEPFLSWHQEFGTWRLTVCTNIKNYSGEWEAFLDFIAPHLETNGYIGTYRYEEDDDPTLLYAEAGKILRKTVNKESNRD